MELAVFAKVIVATGFTFQILKIISIAFDIEKKYQERKKR